MTDFLKIAKFVVVAYGVETVKGLFLAFTELPQYYNYMNVKHKRHIFYF